VSQGKDKRRHYPLLL